MIEIRMDRNTFKQILRQPKALLALCVVLGLSTTSLLIHWVTCSPTSETADLGAPASQNEIGADDALVEETSHDEESHEVAANESTSAPTALDQPAQARPTDKPSLASLRQLLKKHVNPDDPLASTRKLSAERLSGRAHDDFWNLFRTRKGLGVYPVLLKLQNETFLIVADTQDGAGCNYFYASDGRYVVSLCGSYESEWNWRIRKVATGY